MTFFAILLYYLTVHCLRRYSRHEHLFGMLCRIWWCGVTSTETGINVTFIWKFLQFFSLYFSNSISSRTLILEREVVTIITTCINFIEIFMFINILYFCNFYPPENNRVFFLRDFLI